MVMKILVDLLKVDRLREYEVIRGHKVTCE